MKKSSKIRSFKALILGQLLLGSLCVSARADWNHPMLAEAEECLSAQGHIDDVTALQNIDRYTSAALVIAEETLQNIQASGAKVKDLAEQKKSIEAVADVARDIQTRIEGKLAEVIADADPASIGLVSEELEQKILAARINFTTALDISRRIQTKLEHLKPAYRSACFQ
jgi:hypothetical protein